MNTNINSYIYNITPYQPGKPIDEVKRELGLKDVIKLASNENPLGPSPKAMAAARGALAGVNRYPDGDCFYLKQKLAQRLGVGCGNLIFGNGSDEILDLIVKTFLNPRREEIITSDVTFLEYRITGQIFGARVKEIPLRNLKYDLAAIKGAISKKTKIIFIANPNNPTGTYVNVKEFNSFLRSIPQDIIVVYDEAYGEYVDRDDFPYGIRYFREKNFIALKTFSKIYGLAGLRLGWGVTNAAFVEAMNRVRQPFNVNSVAQAAAMAALDDTEYVKLVKKVTLEGKEFLCRQFDEMRLDYAPSVTNFILVKTGRNAFEDLLKMGVIVRPMDMYGLKGYIRVTIGKKEENERFIGALKKVITGEAR
jgi:histidinol-phosphate aminotransferase